jgi:hypothetical protein
VFNGRQAIHWSLFHLRGYCSSDASDIGASGICLYPRGWVHTWTDKQAWHINVFELWAVCRNLVLWAPQWGNHNVAVATNNATIVAWINNRFSCSSQTMAILRKIFWILAKYHIQLWAKWIPLLQNSASDARSRFHFDLLHSYTGLCPDQLTLMGPILPSSLILPSPPLLPQLSHHLQMLLPLKKSWDWSPSRV